MRRLWACLALLACDDGGGTRVEGDAAVVDPCAEIAALDGEPAGARGRLIRDRMRVQCGGGGGRLDTALRFTPDRAGAWLIEAWTDAGEPLSVSLRERCAAPASQRACAEGRLIVDLTTDAEVVLVVEAPGAAPVEFEVTARPAPGPRIESARVHVNPTYSTYGVQVDGEALARPVQTVSLTLLDIDGLPHAATPEPILLGFDGLDAEGGRFSGRVSRTAFDLVGVTAAVVAVLDADQLPSPPVEVVVEPPEDADAVCDPRRAIAECPEGQLCGPSGCERFDPGCPEDWAVRTLQGPGTFVGNTSGAPPHGAGSCGGGVGSEVFEFRAPDAGTYLFEVTSAGHPDPLLFLRAVCGSMDVAAELGCNDDAVPGDLERSSVVVDLAAGEVAYLFVDGYAEEQSTGGAFELRVAAVNAPTIDDGLASVNLDAQAVGVRVAGADADGDLAYAWMLLLDADGMIIETAADDAFDVGFESLEQAEGRYTASATVAFLDPLDELADLALIGVWVTDAAGLHSDLAVLDVEPAEALESGSQCDILAAFGGCPDPELCARLGPLEDPARCAEPVTVCPADWGVVDLHAEPAWSHQGTTAQQPNHGDLASCSGGGPDRVYRFVAPASARFEFAVVEASPGADSVLFARTHCAFSQAAFELACNDDRSPDDYLSTIELDLRADQTIYLFVGGYGASDLGRFTLRAERL